MNRLRILHSKHFCTAKEHAARNLGSPVPYVPTPQLAVRKQIFNYVLIPHLNSVLDYFSIKCRSKEA